MSQNDDVDSIMAELEQMEAMHNSKDVSNDEQVQNDLELQDTSISKNPKRSKRKLSRERRPSRGYVRRVIIGMVVIVIIATVFGIVGYLVTPKIGGCSVSILSPKVAYQKMIAQYQSWQKSIITNVNTSFAQSWSQNTLQTNDNQLKTLESAIGDGSERLNAKMVTEISYAITINGYLLNALKGGTIPVARMNSVETEYVDMAKNVDMQIKSLNTSLACTG